MKIKKAVIALSALTLAALLCGCTQDSSGASVSSSKGSASSAVSSTEAASQNNEENTLESTAAALLKALSGIDKMGAGGLEVNEKETVSENGYEYAKVTDTRFINTEDIDRYMKNYLTDRLIALRYSSLLGTDTPRFIDKSGLLYQRIGAMGGGFTWSDSAPELSEITDSSFTLKADYDNYGSTDTITLKVISENSVWKIDSIEAE